ncbi:GNAT family N-acetyltransferase [Candidatus Bathyarchaeota archaeon]|nr:GNAT family N-acetyltransferase [Candidatus Bathyarchaeota archaeon]
MLKGKIVDLVIVERTDLNIVKNWINDVDFVGEFEPFQQFTLAMLEKEYDKKSEYNEYFIQNKEGVRIGLIMHFKAGDQIGIGYMLVPLERGKGYGSEAVKIMVDYIFLHKNIVRIQAETHTSNIASQRVLEKAGFQKEGVLRKSFFSRGVWRDTAMFSILRDEWEKPKVLPLGYNFN